MSQSAEGTICIKTHVQNRPPLQGSGICKPFQNSKLYLGLTEVALSVLYGQTVCGKVPTARPVTTDYEILGNDEIVNKLTFRLICEVYVHRPKTFYQKIRTG